MQKNGKLENKAHKLWDKFSAANNEGFWASYDKLLTKAKKRCPTFRLPRLPKPANVSPTFKQKPITSAKKHGIHAPSQVTKAVLLTLVLFGITCLFFFVPFWLSLKVENAEKQDKDSDIYSLPAQIEKLQATLESDNPQKTEQWLRAQLSPAEKDTLAHFAERFPELTHTRLVKHYMYMYGLFDYSKTPFNLDNNIELHQIYRLYNPGDTVVWYTKTPQKAPQRVIKKGDNYYIRSGDATLKKIAQNKVYQSKLKLDYYQSNPVIKRLINPPGHHRKYQWFYVNAKDTVLIKPKFYDDLLLKLITEKVTD